MTPLKFANETLTAYKRWVSENPQHITEIETFSRYLSYFVAGKINKSPVFSEFVYATSNLFTLYNDIVIRKSQGEVSSDNNTTRDRLKLWLTILHYCEVFVELTLRNKWGDRGKWTAATSIQIVRCVANLVLIHKYAEIPVQQPPVPILHRKKFAEDNISKEFNNEGFVLKRSGRLIRKVEGTPPASLRNWKPLNNNIQTEAGNSGDVNKKKIAETLYALKPLIHLGSVACFGTESWKQWLTYLGCDLVSLHLHRNQSSLLNYEESIEINRRKLSLILYLLRSPMYQKYSASIIDNKLTSLSNKLPFTAFICNPIKQYISHWQDTYFYMWSN